MQLDDHQYSTCPSLQKVSFLIEREKFCKTLQKIRQTSEWNFLVTCQLQDLYVITAATKEGTKALRTRMHAVARQVGVEADL